ncbi:MAG: HpsJ family protein [Chroococcidiopsidaceae cyanobacterium CP_BM_ER_R8_30]|nr:HpsJ family protein [Chroococcidiopsidaceae cyanobacterium CP_BM_ER_R8_30]
MTQSDKQFWSSSILRPVGYGLLVLALLDVIATFVPSNFTDPNWEFQTIGSLVEPVPIPLLGLMLVLYGDANNRKKWEKPVLKLFSWAALLVGLLFLLLIPLAITDVGRLEAIKNVQVSNQSAHQLSQLQQLGEQVHTGTIQDISNLISHSSAPFYLPPIDVQDPQKFKNQVSAEITQAKKQVQIQAEMSKAQNHVALLKDALKWSLGALVSTVLFIRLWQVSSWTRQNGKSKKA